MNRNPRTQTRNSTQNLAGPDTNEEVQEINLGRTNSFLHVWYHFTGPSNPGGNADFQAHEAFRRGRLASLALLFLLVVIVIFMASIGITSNLNLSVYLSSWIGILILGTIAIILNRRGNLMAVVVLMVLIIDGGLVTDLLTVKGGLGLVNLPLLDLLIASELITVSLLAPVSVFIVALLNSILVIFIVLFDPHRADDLKHYLDMSGLAVVLVRPILLELAVSLVTFFWATSTLKALKRADRAEAIANLERTLAQHERAQAAQKYALEQNIQHLIEIQRRIANGDIAARIPITEDNVLWQVAISFNNLLTRHQRLHEDSEHFQQLRREISRLVQTIHLAKRTHTSIKIARGGTELDALILELTS